MSHPHGTRSVIGTALSFFADVALKVNWYSLYLLEDRKWKAAHVMDILVNYLQADKKVKIPLDKDDVRKFRALYRHGVTVVEWWHDDNGIRMPYQYGVAYNIYPAEKDVTAGIRGRKIIQKQMVQMAEFDSGAQPLPASGATWKDIRGFTYLTPLNPVRSKAGLFSTFRMIRIPIPIREGWAGYDANQIIKNAQLFLSHWDPVKNMVVEEPVNIDIAHGSMHIVSIDWHSKMTDILWEELLKVMERLHKQIMDKVEEEEIDETAFYTHIGGGGTAQLLEDLGGEEQQQQQASSGGEEGSGEPA